MEWNFELEKTMKHFSKLGGFLSVKNKDEVNTMTVSWGFIGYMWARPCFITVVRPQRHTKIILDEAMEYTISIPYDKMQEELKICGTKSGRDIDKSKVVNFLPAKSIDSVIVDNCDIYYECKCLYREPMKKELLPPDIIEKIYKDDYHISYIGEIVDVYKDK